MKKSRHGHLELICGPMFAGKTTALVQRLAAARDARKRVIAFKPAADTRSGDETLRTHTGETFPAKSVSDVREIAEAADGYDVVGIDEAHFFGRGFLTVCSTLVDQGVNLFVTGVDFDHRGGMFSAVSRVMRHADHITRLTSTCARCGAEAVYTQRLVAGDAPIVVGGAEAYEPRCAECFTPPI